MFIFVLFVSLFLTRKWRYFSSSFWNKPRHNPHKLFSFYIWFELWSGSFWSWESFLFNLYFHSVCYCNQFEIYFLIYWIIKLHLNLGNNLLEFFFFYALSLFSFLLAYLNKYAFKKECKHFNHITVVPNIRMFF